MFMRFSIVNNATKFCRKQVQIVNGECVNKSAVLVPFPSGSPTVGRSKTTPVLLYAHHLPIKVPCLTT